MGSIANQADKILDWVRTRRNRILAEVFGFKVSVHPEVKGAVEETVKNVRLQKEAILDKYKKRVETFINNTKTTAEAFDLGKARLEVSDIIADAIDEIVEAQCKGINKVVELINYDHDEDDRDTMFLENDMRYELDIMKNEGDWRLDDLRYKFFDGQGHYEDFKYVTNTVKNARDEVEEIYQDAKGELYIIKLKYEDCRNFLYESEKKIDLIAEEGKRTLKILKKDTIKQLKCIPEERGKQKQTERQNTGNIQKPTEAEDNAVVSNNSDNKGFEAATQMPASSNNPVPVVPVSDNKEVSEIVHDEKSPEGKVQLSQESLLIKNETENTENLEDVSTSISSIGSDLKRMFYAKDNLADIELEMKDDFKLHSHAFVLSARSPALRMIIAKEMKRIDYQGKIKLENINENVMGSILHWIYAEEFKEDLLQNWQSIREVVEAAVELELKDLLKLLEDKIIGLCEKENMIELYQIVDKYGLLEAKKYIRNFIKMS